MNRQKQLHIMAIVTMLAVLFLIWVGGTVRATGAGMGCPDWPTCFGRVVPPFSAADLPPDYRHTYARLGYDKMPFDPVKTWTEYLNRLTGTLIGLLSILTCVLAFLARRQDNALPWLAGGALGLVMLNGWLGAVVIDTNLHSAVVTTHMMLSFGVLFLLMAVVTRTFPSSSRQPARIGRRGFLLLPIAMVITVVQTGLGAQVRERVDQMGTNEHLTTVVSWLDHVGAVLNVHMAGALIVIIINLWLMLRFFGTDARVNRALGVLFLIVIIQILSGTMLITLHLPTLLQPLHLLGASMLFTTQAFLLLVPTRAEDQKSSLHHGRPTTN
ncbi:COX15/CtaA family protein [Halothiobacillus neapolitanus]|uniref:Cytochrome oxidase assembly n=1 Tax=Halothiobacillus neapolitanus (strain ATCC 23641 / DSM 15147 / CIP 104769 / NCIMB 8539 / c2) TaxID=555778 RepID=D0KXL9_HALNC|nr:COX15/CtaA family protein [Halothiobacillus neapolitanus]ACX97207.1 cytochrome oxidase assembly [Halothiobacillus neapolitanus c2]TDN60342.1 cytochrome c oxidase assembly protein subunit 15 [Halothiobacillus neapolitanus]